MRRLFQHIALLLVITSVAFAGAGTKRVAVPPGTQIDNSALVKFNYMNGQKDSLWSNVVSVVVQGEVAFRISKIALRDTVLPGDTLTYLLVIKNTGTLPLNNVQIVDSLPSQVSVLNTNGGRVIGSSVVWNISTVPVGKIDTLRLVVRIAPATAFQSQFANYCFAKDSSTNWQRDSVRVTVGPEPSLPLLTLSKSVSRDTVQVGESLIYKIQIRNNGNVQLTQVAITDTLSMLLLKPTISPNAVIKGQVISYIRPTLQVGELDSIVIQGTVSLDAIDGTILANKAFAKSVEVSEKFTIVTTIIKANRGIVLNKIVSSDSLFAGDTLKYVVKFQNTGAVPLTNISVSDTLPAQITSATIIGKGLLNGRVVEYNIDTLRAGAIDSVVFTATVSNSVAVNERIVNTAYLATRQTQTISAQALTIIKARPVHPELTILKTASADTVKLGGLFTYTINLKNSGDVSLSQVVLRDTINNTYLQPISVSDNAQLEGNIVTYRRDVLIIDEADSLTILVRVRPDQEDGKSVLNIAYAVSQQTESQVVVALARIITKSPTGGTTTNPKLAISKSVTKQTVLVNDSLSYIIRFENTGDVTLAYVTVIDTLPSQISILRLSPNASVSNGIITYWKDSLIVGQSDSVIADVRLNANRYNNEIITNTVYALSAQTRDSSVISFKAKVIIPDRSCRIHLTAKPLMVIGNGIDATVIEGFVTDTTGKPKPDGTPVLFKTDVGFFSNGRDSLVAFVKDGYVKDSLRAIISSSTIIKAFASVSVSDSEICNAKQIIEITFYPGAIAGIVVNNITREPVKGAIVRVFSSSNIEVGNQITEADGRYLIPVPKTDNYRITIQVTDIFGLPIITGTLVSVTVPGTGGNPPVLNKAMISGKVYFLVSNRPVAGRPVQVILRNIEGGPTPVRGSGKSGIDSIFSSMVTSGTAVDSTMTDSLSTFTFINVPPARYIVTISDPFLNGEMTAGEVNDGKYTMNVNIPIILNPNIIFKKEGPAKAFQRDTVTYSISLTNIGNLSANNTKIVDSLDASMKFVEASTGGSYDPITHKVSWLVGKLDSLGGGNNTRMFWVKVRFIDTLNMARQLVNSSIVTSDETTPILSQVRTEIFPISLHITKTALRKVLEVGDVVTYVVTVTNSTLQEMVKDVQIVDRFPLGFGYLPGSSFVGNLKVADPIVGKTLIWNLADTLRPLSTIQFSYKLVVGAGGVESNGINYAQALAQSRTGIPVASDVASEKVEVRRGIFTEHGLIIGKVFYDDNRNAYQDSGEVGVKGIELIMEDGTRIITGDDGKYSLPDVLPGEHVIMVRKHTISPNTEIITGYNQFAYEPTSRFVKVTPSGIARADFYLALLKKPEPPMPDTVSLDQSITKVGNIEVQRITEPKNVVFIEDERSAPIKLPGFTFEVAKAKLRVEAYLILTLLADIMKEDPDQPLIVVGHTDSVRINTKEFKNNTELSIARANAVRNYLVEKMGIDPKRITARGYGETRPVASNKTTEGRAMNRRVEFFFAESIELPKRDSMAIVFKIPVKYEGAVNVSKLEINDILDTALHFNDGYGVLGDTTIPAKVEGNHINWTIDSIGRYFNKTLVYKVYVKHPSERILRLPSFSTSFKYYIGDSVVSASDTLRTLNQVAVAIRGRAVNFILSGVVFDVAKATLRTTALTALEVVGEMLKQDTTTTAIIEGHTDSSPIHTNEFPSNVQLSQARAKTVKERLTKAFGINPNRMRIVGFGPYRPVATNRTSEGRQANRRVEVRIFREEFVERVIPEGFVDSSSIAGARFYSEVGKDLVDTLSYGCIGDEFLFKLEVRRPVSNKTIQMVLIDSLPAGFTYVPNSLRLIRGIDSISHSSIIYAHCSLNDSVASLSFLVQINGTVSPEELIHHKFYIQRKEHTGQIITDEVRPLIIQVRNKRF